MSTSSGKEPVNYWKTFNELMRAIVHKGVKVMESAPLDETTSESETPNVNFEDLCNAFPESHLSEIQGFVAPDDVDLLNEYTTDLITWTKNSRKLFFAIQKEAAEQSRVQFDRQERQRAEAEIISGLRDQAERIYLELRSHATNLKRVEVYVARENEEPVDAPSPIHVDSMSGSEVVTNHSIFQTYDVDAVIRRVEAALDDHVAGQQLFQTKLQELKDEVQSIEDAQMAEPEEFPRIRPVDISEEDIAIEVARLVNEKIPLFLNALGSLQEHIVEDNSAYEALHKNLEYPLRFIDQVLRRFRIAGNPIEHSISFDADC